MSPIPILLACSYVHQNMIKKKKRSKFGIIIESAEPREPHHFSMLFGYGASAINPYIVNEIIDYHHELGFIKNISKEEAISNFNNATAKGILKVMNKIGISTLNSYRGSQIFEALGLKTNFINKYFKPEIQIQLTKELLKFANSSIDISDGLIDDLKKMINKQKLSFKIYEDQIPISKNLHNYLIKNNFKKLDFISNGDDYQILFTASSNKSRIIKNISKKLGVKISRIGEITSNKTKPTIIDKKGKYLLTKYSGYKHLF